ncbi:MAG: hypothetical protein FWE10_00975 [Rikenellaceae bacterium]|nr:hypothetical protein [Rikenellaceae bacterium]MCL2692309.1 hypothetical protein [Rikenellaceae bacterium]
MAFYSTYSMPALGGGDVDFLTDDAVAPEKESTLTAEDIAAIVHSALASLRVYVVESDITAAQNSVRAVVEEATF